MIKIVIVDDHPLVREGLKKVLSREKLPISVIGEVYDGESLFELMEDQEPDIVTLDIELPGESGLDVLKQLRKEYPDLPVLMLSTYPAERYAIRSLKAGAAGYLSKRSIPAEIENALKTIVYEKKRYITPEVAEVLVEQIDDHSKSNQLHKSLSDREFQVMCMIASGMEIRQIARNLNLGVRTIHTYRSRMLEKMKLETNVDVAHYAINHNLINEFSGRQIG